VQALFMQRDTGTLSTPHFAEACANESDETACIIDGRFLPGAAGDFNEVCGQRRYKRAAEIAAAGGHNILVFGPPGVGKTMLATRMGSIMPRLLPEEAVAVTRLYSLTGAFSHGGGLIAYPPFRAPHHSASAEGVMGGGRTVKPGEISLAHNGILFLDEAPEFRINVLQSLREPLEEGCVTISRADGPVALPADFQLVLAANPCPCGRLGKRSPAEMRHIHDKNNGSTGASAGIIERGTGKVTMAVDNNQCLCAADQVKRYWKKFGQALLDRIELRVPVNSPLHTDMENSSAERSAQIAERVLRAVIIQRERFARGADTQADGAAIRRNAKMRASQIKKYCRLQPDAKAALRSAVEKLEFSGRAYHAVLRVARTIADLDGKDSIGTEHILEAVSYRRYGDDPFDVFEAEE
jgi:magnesium chelatase family protein